MNTIFGKKDQEFEKDLKSNGKGKGGGGGVISGNENFIPDNQKKERKY